MARRVAYKFCPSASFSFLAHHHRDVDNQANNILPKDRCPIDLTHIPISTHIHILLKVLRAPPIYFLFLMWCIYPCTFSSPPTPPIKNRASSATKCNDRSSRSHSVFTLTIHGFNAHTHQHTNGALLSPLPMFDMLEAAKGFVARVGDTTG